MAICRSEHYYLITLPLFFARFGNDMVQWCRKCGALIGVREPILDWSVDRNAVCRWCIAKKVGRTDEARFSDNGEAAEGSDKQLEAQVID
jgi:hypothetical protein